MKRDWEVKIATRADVQKMKEREAEKDRNCEVRTAQRDTWKKWETNGERNQRYSRLQDVCRGRNEGKLRKEKRNNKQLTKTMATSILMTGIL